MLLQKSMVSADITYKYLQLTRHKGERFMSILGQILANAAPTQAQKQEKTAAPAGGKRTASGTAGSTSSASGTSQTVKAAQLSSAQASVKADSLVRGEVIDLRPNQVLVRLENGAQLSARLEGSIALYIGQKADFFVSQTTDSLITLKLAPSSSTKDPVMDKILQSANLQKNERTIAIVNELLAHQQPVTGTNIRHFLMLSSKYPDLPVRDLILMELHQIPVSDETAARFAEYRADSHRLLAQGTTLFNILSEQISSLPNAAEQTAFIKELQTLLYPATATEDSLGTAQTPEQAVNIQNGTTTEAFGSSMQPLPSAMDESLPSGSHAANENGTVPGTLPETGTVVSGESNPFHSAPAALTENTAASDNSPLLPPDSPVSTDNTKTTNYIDNEFQNIDTLFQQQTANTASESLTATNSSFNAASALLSGTPSELLADLKQKFLNSFLLSPKEIAENGKVADYYNRLNEQLAGLEQLAAKLSKSTGGDAAQAPAKQLRSNLSFMDMVNQVFPYVQLPLQLKERPAHGELYVYERKRSLSDSGSLSALLHLELDALGTTDIFVTLTASNVAARFYLADEAAKYLIASELPTLHEALERQGYSVQTEVTLREDHPEDSSLLEQFLEEHSPSELHRYTFDIRA